MEYQFESHKERKLTVLTFKDVTNSGVLLKQIIAGNLGVEASFFNASLIPDITPIIAAANKALFAESRGKLVTRTLYSEIIFNVSGSKHITETLKRWGISESSTGLVVAKFDATPAELQIIRDSVKGSEIDNADVGQLMDLKATKKAYHIADPELQVGSLTDAILTRIAVRDCS
eukprot:CAMPEP_0118935438 /NCGR_PEP_ID=MMETSP1169-20130426/15644_1 /TAXON_ID=36882 /ORGANISM="Pyramimonas obovata, Strain CCMP722" /LENGTH=173 /DNA_ID=CAMNT_0006878479 /DNA_START=94 /DNA_END=615 /DNA_ORIENTATION=+